MRLSVLVKQSTTRARCFAPAGLVPSVSAFQSLLNTMPVSDSRELFGERGTENIDVGLPLRYTSRESICLALSLRSSDPSTNISTVA